MIRDRLRRAEPWIAIAAMALVAALLLAHAARASEPITVQVARVIDGDSIALIERSQPFDLPISVRVRGINAPEMRSTCRLAADRAREYRKAVRARDALAKLVAESGSRVTLLHVSDDKYGGRVLADVRLADGRDVGGLLWAGGFADQYDGRGPRKSWCGR